MKKKNIVKVNESKLRELVTESVKSVLREFDEYGDNEYYEFPEEVYEWGRKVQELGLELSRIIGQYRGELDWDVMDVLLDIQSEYNAICGDLNTYSIASHYES